jgi:hypothetical protein
VSGPGGGSPAAPGARAHGIELVGYTEAAGSPVFKLALQVVEDRWYLYATHFWEPRISVLDVTDPASPTLVAAIEGPEHTATWQVQVADGLLVQGMEHIPGPWGGDPSRPGDEGVRIFDVRDPRSPELLGHWRTGDNGVHRNHWTGGRYVHCAAHQPGFDGNLYVILDIEDPRNPTVAGRWFVPEQFTAGGAASSSRISLHGPAYVEGDRAYLPYGAAGLVILDISDVTRPKQISRLEIGGAFSSMIAMHTAIPRPGRKLLLVNTEAIAERSQEPYNFAGIVDVSDETKPRLVSLLPIPVPDDDAGYPNFSLRGGRFGPHNQHHPQNGDPNLNDRDDLMFLTWFNAGLRVYDIRDEYLPREIASYLPDDPVERRGLLPKDLVTQSEDVLVDARGYIYLSDKNHGLHVLSMPGLSRS